MTRGALRALACIFRIIKFVSRALKSEDIAFLTSDEVLKWLVDVIRCGKAARCTRACNIRYVRLTRNTLVVRARARKIAEIRRLRPQHSAGTLFAK